MSAFYLDILKDRLYTSRKDSLKRRSAQTAMYLILEGIVKLMAPVLSFTADEVWLHMPKQEEESVHLAQFPPLHPEFKNGELVEKMGPDHESEGRSVQGSGNRPAPVRSSDTHWMRP